MDRVLYLTQLSELTPLPLMIPLHIQNQLATETVVEHGAKSPYYAILKFKEERGDHLNTRELNSLAWHEAFVQWCIRHKKKVERVKLGIANLVKTAILSDGMTFSVVMTTIAHVAVRRRIVEPSDEVQQLEDAIHRIGYAARQLPLDEQTVLNAMWEACCGEFERWNTTRVLICLFRTWVCLHFG
ncbi:uncharacterized protein BDZ99DRAFT_519018 [Mytilinidion resinicola]|uniref:Uncharacterized protein n=1 Tax=Mytilinidion resinicola TaxID=574789 RepID=A0A6A6YT77_9PEZI|nr:uncharacterized protein BDZ99DRAFT_519018 [Mytilinidion resinicola]KAF2811768.1 hypothetical protein BDZ99DRAFT_519018 [Mytilinidion resinicola]